ncbi:PAP/fibrillin family protein [Pleurocapsales cyanobacterium LEGE 10410]|nr:PAP/fibrillin family protein [Pleurocapsales cyanobacterium LEGE 10410]
MSKKAELLEAIAGKNRGLLANEIDNVRVLSAIQQLEDTNPTKQPLEAKDLLNGDWRLLYTTSKGILGLDRFPLLKMGQIYQCIRVSEAKVYNIAEIIGLPMLEGLVSVAATFEPVSDKRVNVMFERSIIGLQRLFGYNTPAKFIQQIESGKKFFPFDFKIERTEQKGWLDITYLDEDMRIGRGNEGNVFVLTKETSLAI